MDTLTPLAPRAPERIGRWARTYRLPLALTVCFVLLLALLAMFRSPAPTGVRQQRPEQGAVSPVASVCPACGIAQRCDKATGQCRLEEVTPKPCVRGSHYDDEAGFCVPDPTARPTAAPKGTLRPAASASPKPSPSASAAPSPSSSPSAQPEPTPHG